MALVHDLVGLNTCSINAMTLVGIDTHFSQLANQNPKLSIAGSRHSQGGHTVSTGANVALAEAMNAVAFNAIKTVTVDAGATWNNIHHVLSPLGLSVPVQQSSPYFTVCGSISVNCHGRDPRQSPLIDSIVSLDLILANGTPFHGVMSTGPHADLFAAVVGGYGSCGFISKATLKTCPDTLLKRQYTYFQSLDGYITHLASRDERAQPHLHHAMLNFSQPRGRIANAVGAIGDAVGGWVDTITGGAAKPAQANVKPDFFVDLFCVDYWPVDANAERPEPMPVRSLSPSSWAHNDALNIAWQTARTNGAFRSITWEMLKGYFGVTRVDYRNRWLREDVNFSAHLEGERRSTDLLQEYFIPRVSLIDFVSKLRALLIKNNVTVLNATLRIVKQQQANNHLPYCSKGDMMCLAIDFVSELVLMDVIEGKPSYQPSENTSKWVKQAIDYAIVAGGSYYLPYYGFADLNQFQTAYPGHTKASAARNAYDADKKLSNQFLEKYNI